MLFIKVTCLSLVIASPIVEPVRQKSQFMI